MTTAISPEKAKAIRWLKSPTGQKALTNVIEEAKQTSNAFTQSLRIDRHMLFVPMGPIDGSGVWPYQE